MRAAACCRRRAPSRTRRTRRRIRRRRSAARLATRRTRRDRTPLTAAPITAAPTATRRRPRTLASASSASSAMTARASGHWKRSARSGDFRDESAPASSLRERQRKTGRAPLGCPIARTPRRSPRPHVAAPPPPTARPRCARCGRDGICPAARSSRRESAHPVRCRCQARRPGPAPCEAAASASSMPPSPLSPSDTMQHRAVPTLALVLEHFGGRRERAAQIGGGIAEVVGAGRIEKEAEGGAIGGERQAEERRFHRTPRARLCRPARRRPSPMPPAWPRRAVLETDRSRSSSGKDRATPEHRDQSHHVPAPIAELRPGECENRETQCGNAAAPREPALNDRSAARSCVRAWLDRQTWTAPRARRGVAARTSHATTGTSARRRRASGSANVIAVLMAAIGSRPHRAARRRGEG